MAAERMSREQRLVLSIAVLASFVTFLDGSVVNVAVAPISAELGGGIATQQWVVDAYLVSLGTLILLAGSLSDVFGRQRILVIGLVGFGVASVAIALAPTALALILFRGVQGIAGALLVPSSLALIISTFSGAAQARAIGMWTGLTSASFLAGPVLGGLFIDYLSWRLVFAINILPIAVTLALIAVLHEPDEHPADRGIDWLGAGLGIVGLGGPVWALIEQERYGWGSPAVLVPLAAGGVALVAFVLRQRTAAHPMVPLALFAARNFSVGNVATAFVYAALSLGGFVLVVYLQVVAGYPATLAGLASLPVSLGNVLLSSVFGRLAGRLGPRLFMGLGPIVGAIGYLLMLSTGERVDYWTQVLPGILVFTVGLSATVAPLTAAILGAVPPERSGIGSAINNAVARIAGLVATAFVGVIVGSRYTVEGFHRALVVVAGLLALGGVVSLIGITNRRAPGAAEPDAAEPGAAEPGAAGAAPAASGSDPSADERAAG
ncbi:DHA2 family efflux MFS transporter permease subunit [Galbitalea sp. SE-J8]|uniref:DHA2 family efflux MFS transporter permease subunit n=1 Tax=Galbitalea sp. SE-J8 TaxID=3054952 RepID=UPI00259CD958|nr:DHA2 family efflux MFS transporter permease subunit [Galbitalea sp. SE-J8]MDM4761781.1 DHA2 family efflux MFS transporter permease subunit [Galbitalea sp. SE-J8]